MTVQTTVQNSLQYFLDRFQARAAEPALIQDAVELSYGELLRTIERRARDLENRGIAAGSVVLAVSDSALDQVVDFFALASIRVTVVPLPVLPAAEIDEVAGITGATHVAEGDAVHPTATAATCQTVACHPLIANLVRRQESGLVVLSSGTTGNKKAILHSVDRLMEKYTTPRPAYRTIVFLKMDHLGGINTVLHCLANGGVALFPHSRKADAICDLIERRKVELLPSTPSFLRLLLLGDYQARYDLSSLKLITYGTEVMPQSTLTELSARFPGVKLQQTYGMSELGVLRSKSESSESLWVKLGGEGFQTKVAAGRLWVKADSAMEGYLNCPQPFDADGWLDTGDRVEVNGEYVRVLGRESDLINVGGEKVYPSAVEDFLLGLPNIADAVVRPEPNPLTGNIVVADLVLKEPEPADAVVRRVKLSSKGHLARFMIPVVINVVDCIPQSDRYKKQRR